MTAWTDSAAGVYYYIEEAGRPAAFRVTFIRGDRRQGDR